MDILGFCTLLLERLAEKSPGRVLSGGVKNIGGHPVIMIERDQTEDVQCIEQLDMERVSGDAAAYADEIANSCLASFNLYDERYLGYEAVRH